MEESNHVRIDWSISAEDNNSMGCLMDVDYFILLHVSTSMDDLHIRIRVKVSKTSILLGFPIAKFPDTGGYPICCGCKAMADATEAQVLKAGVPQHFFNPEASSLNH